MNVEKESTVDIVASKFSKMSFIPTDEKYCWIDKSSKIKFKYSRLPNMVRLVELVEASCNGCD